jgi:hypothetical protein
MQKVFCCILILIFAVTQSISAQQIDKVIISGYGGQHDIDVKNAFLIGYSSYNQTPFTGDVILYSNTLQSSFNYAVANSYDLIIRSTSGLSTGLNLAPNYPTVELVMPAGSNNYTQAFFGDVITSPVVITGAGVDSNLTGFKLEFFSIDPITATNASSYANGYVAGQLAFVANTLNCNFDSARALARTKGSENGSWDFYNGFGKVQLQNMITNPLPVELSSFTAKVIGKSIRLNWQSMSEINNFGFEIERTASSTIPLQWEKIGFVNGNGNSNSPKSYSFVDNYPNSSGEIWYRLKQIDNDGQFEYSKEVNVAFSVNNFELYQNYPNPFNPSTTISYQLPVDGRVKIVVFDLLGNEICNLIDEYKTAGKYKTNFDGSILSSGMYLYKIEIWNNELLYSMINKMTLLK